MTTSSLPYDEDDEEEEEDELAGVEEGADAGALGHQYDSISYLLVLKLSITMTWPPC